MNLLEQFKAAMARYEQAVKDNKPEEAEAALTEAEGIKSQMDAAEKAAKLEQWAKTVQPVPVDAQDKTPQPTPAPEQKAAPVVYKRARPVDAFKAANGQTAEERAYGFGQIVLAATGNQKAAKWCAEHNVKVHQEGVNETGGYLVPDTYSNDMIDLLNEYGSFRRNVRVVPMSSDAWWVPRKTGGLTAYWVAESAATTESTSAYDRVNLTAKKLMALTTYSSEVGEDAIIDLGNELARDIATAFAYAEDQAGWNGDGSATYGGITGVKNAFLNISATRANIAGLKVATTNTKTAWSNITLTDFHGVMGKLAGRWRPGAKWYTNPTLYDEAMVRLAAAAGGNTIQTIQGGASVPAFLGYPVEFVDVMPGAPTADVPICYFGNLPLAAKMGDRRNVTLAASTEYRFAYDELAIRGTERIDIVVHDLGNESATASLRVPGPLVGLLADA